jgi:hypothetical protein
LTGSFLDVDDELGAYVVEALWRAQWLSADALVDKYRIRVHPVALGAELTLFPRLPSPKRLTLVEARPFSSGVVPALAVEQLIGRPLKGTATIASPYIALAYDHSGRRTTAQRSGQ